VRLTGPSAWGTVALSLAMGVGLFFLLPMLLVSLVDRSIASPLLSNLAEGVVRLGVFVLYLWGIGFMPDIRRVFAYHGAEHKTINAYEAGADLTPDTVARFSLQHARCGTAFMLTLVLLSILVFTLLGPLPMFWRLVSRVLLIPVLAGAAVEYLRWTANHLDSRIVRALIKPNLALQSLTTREPDRAMLEVAIQAFQSMRQAEQEFAL